MNNQCGGCQVNARRELPTLQDSMITPMVNSINKSIQLPRKPSLMRSLPSSTSSSPDTSRYGHRREKQVCSVGLSSRAHYYEVEISNLCQKNKKLETTMAGMQKMLNRILKDKTQANKGDSLSSTNNTQEMGTEGAFH
uniref:Uncharacterized protein n=1 Tax=Cannabis sativa TaxID=3483 RepID=A0A803PIA3_CANSA